MTKKTRKRKVKKPYTLELPICMDNMLVQRRQIVTAERNQLETELAAAVETRQRSRTTTIRAQISDLDADLSELEAEIVEETEVYLFRAIPGKAFDALLRAHKPSDEQKAAAKKLAEDEGLPKAAALQMKYDPDTFAPALISKTLAQPKMTPEEVIEEIWTNDAWNPTEKSALFETARNVCNGLSLPR